MSEALRFFNKKLIWQDLNLPEDFKEIPGYQQWKNHFNVTKPPMYPNTRDESFKWINNFIMDSSTDARNAVDHRRYRNMCRTLEMDSIPSAITFFRILKVERSQNLELFQREQNWDYRPEGSLLSKMNNSVKLEGSDSENYQKQIEEWLSKFRMYSGNPNPGLEEQEKDLDAFRSLVFMRIGLWNPISDEKMREASAFLRMKCSNCPIMKLFNQCMPSNPSGSTLLWPGEDEGQALIQLEMLKNKLMVEYTIFFYVLPHMSGWMKYFSKASKREKRREWFMSKFGKI